METKRSIIMDEAAMQRAITRIAFEIIEKNKGIENLALIGIQRRGVLMANRLQKRLQELEGIEPPMGILDITFHRDDLSLLSEMPVINSTNIDFMVIGKKIILVDDVLFTGRTVRAAIEAVMELGRAAKIELAVMVDRGHRELPIRADYVGKNMPTSRNEIVHVCFNELDGYNEVSLGKLHGCGEGKE
ncbi:MAG: bifunctional pyr operon transcriptional regulator/uracil phosphoribosyltransferase PyrR [Ruminococcaceae bacterium]|nr:bifunctional pyr operon transcriptional regulator/uracil phosphoribosyltransferase PyrR [Oscillospiraceae bacterium]